MRIRILATCLGSILACASIQPIALTVADSGRTIDMVQGQELVLNLNSNPSTGFRWWLADSSEIALIPSARPVYTADPKVAAGGGGVETWRFKAAQAGKQTLRFEYRRSFEESIPPAKTLTYKVVVVK